MKKSEWKHIARTQTILSQELLKELQELQNAWAIDEHIQADGSLHPSLSDTIKRAKYAEDNRDRFMEHLDTIAIFLKIDWWDGDYPIDEVVQAIKRTELAEEHKDGFIKHLDTIANFVGIDWQEGHFPIDEVIEAINKK